MRARAFTRGAVASPHYLASLAGADVLRRGGNAMDAAVAINLVLATVAPYLCGYGGDLFSLTWDGRNLTGYNGSGRSPGNASIDAIDGDRMPEVGPQSVTVPGAVRGWFDLLATHGTWEFGRVAERALELASGGVPLTPTGLAMHRRGVKRFEMAEPLAQWAYSISDFAPRPGFAALLRALSDDGPDAFYTGEGAAAISEATGGWLDVADLASHAPEPIEILEVDLLGHWTLAELGPNTQGATAAQAAWLDVHGPDDVSWSVRCVQHALAEREQITDPKHTPPDLVSEEHLRTMLRRVESGERPAPATPATGGTAYMCAVDAEGMCVSLIQSNYAGYGSGCFVEPFQFSLQNRGAYFRLEPDHPNALEGGKRTLHTLIPAMLLEHGRPRMVFGTMGADGQPQTHQQIISQFTRHGVRDPFTLVDRPRFYVDPATHHVQVEGRFDPADIRSLHADGQQVRVIGDYDSRMGHAHAIVIDGSVLLAASDPRCEGSADGW